MDIPRKNKTPGLEQVAFSRASELQRLAILDEEEVTYDLLCSIGTGGSYAKKGNMKQC